MGGADRGFQETHWTQIIAARTSDTEHRREVLNGLLACYWKPIYCYLRRKGCDNDKAKDLTQGFLHEVVLGRNLVFKADQPKASFARFYCLRWTDG